MSISPTHAMLLAAGRGERMRPITDRIPKPMVEVAGRSLIDRQLDRLVEFGVRDVVVNTAYLADLLESHLSRRGDCTIRFSREEQALETGGGVFHALPMLGDAPFFVMNSDVILRDGAMPALARLADAWHDDLDALLLLHPTERAFGFDGRGDFFCEDGKLRRRGDAASAPYVFTGTQLLHPRLFADAPGGAFSLNLLYDRARAEDGTLDRVGAVIHDGDWLHVGNPPGLAAAEAYLSRHPDGCRD